MDAEQDFIDEIRRDPEDNFARLVYADFLDEHGDKRGELIRVQCQLHDLESNDPERGPLEQHARALLDEHGETWLTKLKAIGVRSVSQRSFQRGLVETVTITPEDYLKHEEQLYRLAPGLRSIHFKQLGDHLGPLVERGLPEQITELNLSSNPLDAAAADLVSRLLYASPIETLRVTFCSLNDAAFQALTSRPLESLRRLDCAVNSIGDVALASFCEDPSAFPQLAELVLKSNPITNRTVASLFRPAGFSELTALDLSKCQLAGDPFSEVLASDRWRTLVRLNLRGNNLSRDVISSLLVVGEHSPLYCVDLRGSIPVERQDQYAGSGETPLPQNFRERFETVY